MLRTACRIAIGLLCLACHAARGAGPADERREMAAIRQRANDYLQAVERGDGDEIASFWTADGDYIDDDGVVTNGRRLAKQARPSSDAAAPRRLAVKAQPLRFIAADVAIEDGIVCDDARAADESDGKRYTALWVRRDGVWLLDGVRELAALRPPPRHPVSELAWMVGRWVSDDGDQSVRMKCTWSDDKHFMLCDIDVKATEREPLHVSQRIGWDARERQIKSWTFDSQGGHGAGLWFHQHGRWVIEAESIASDGSRSTGTHVYELNDANTFTWQATNAEVEGEPRPDRSLRMVRRKGSEDR